VSVAATSAAIAASRACRNAVALLTFTPSSLAAACAVLFVAVITIPVAAVLPVAE
jgi:hypothetical protein